MNNGFLISKTIQYIKTIFANNSGGHDADHSLRVYQNALTLAEKEGECDLKKISLAALLHDVDDHKLFHTENNANARAFLEEHQISKEETDEICEIINAVSFSRNRGLQPQSMEAKIVQDADRLDAIGAIGIARTFAYGGEHGRSLESSVQHFYDKLLLLKDEMNTDAAKEMAEKRHAFLLQYLKELQTEVPTMFREE